MRWQPPQRVPAPQHSARSRSEQAPASMEAFTVPSVTALQWQTNTATQAWAGSGWGPAGRRTTEGTPDPIRAVARERVIRRVTTRRRLVPTTWQTGMPSRTSTRTQPTLVTPAIGSP